MQCTVAALAPEESSLEIVEHKGIGHPDTICDALAERFSVALSSFYLERFGGVLHHNVDKALLCGGAARVRFGGGEVLQPIAITLAGRATRDAGGVRVPIEEIAAQASRAWLRRNMHALDPDRDVVVRTSVRAGSAALTELFASPRAGAAAVANDTSIGVGYAPASPLERAVLAGADALRALAHDPLGAFVGEDVKVMGVRRGESMRLVVACAMVASHVADVDAYVAARIKVEREVAAAANGVVGHDVAVVVNAADDLAAGRAYLTVTGTSAEAGDDGQVGRGNRVNRLITPCRPMTLEAAAGKNPVAHVGKLYNVAAHRIAADVVRALPEIDHAQCFLVSQIGQPIDRPAVVEIRARAREGKLGRALRAAVQEIAREGVAEVPELWRAVLAGGVTVY